jgi:hypothetical protein
VGKDLPFSNVIEHSRRCLVEKESHLHTRVPTGRRGFHYANKAAEHCGLWAKSRQAQGRGRERLFCYIARLRKYGW